MVQAVETSEAMRPAQSKSAQAAALVREGRLRNRRRLDCSASPGRVSAFISSDTREMRNLCARLARKAFSRRLGYLDPRAFL